MRHRTLRQDRHCGTGRRRQDRRRGCRCRYAIKDVASFALEMSARRYPPQCRRPHRQQLSTRRPRRSSSPFRRFRKAGSLPCRRSRRCRQSGDYPSPIHESRPPHRRRRFRSIPVRPTSLSTSGYRWRQGLSRHCCARLPGASRRSRDALEHDVPDIDIQRKLDPVLALVAAEPVMRGHLPHIPQSDRRHDSAFKSPFYCNKGHLVPPAARRTVIR